MDLRGIQIFRDLRQVEPPIPRPNQFLVTELAAVSDEMHAQKALLIEMLA